MKQEDASRFRMQEEKKKIVKEQGKEEDWILVLGLWKKKKNKKL